MAKYKVGDKVRVRTWESMVEQFGLDGTGIKVPGNYFVSKMKCYCGKVVTIARVNSYGEYHIKEDNREGAHSFWWFNDNMLEDVENTIVIYTKGNEVIAVNKSTGETGKAVCAPEDEFDFKIGADLAYDRLMERKPPFHKRKEKNKFNTEVVCISTSESATPFKFTVGKIYNIKNGILKDNAGKKIVCCSVQNLNDHFLYTKFLEVVK